MASWEAVQCDSSDRTVASTTRSARETSARASSGIMLVAPAVPADSNVRQVNTARFIFKS